MLGYLLLLKVYISRRFKPKSTPLPKPDCLHLAHLRLQIQVFLAFLGINIVMKIEVQEVKTEIPLNTHSPYTLARTPNRGAGIGVYQLPAPSPM